jgi:RNA polymerase sigma factor, sigma-70 family
MVLSSCEVLVLKDDMSLVKEVLCGSAESFCLLVNKYENQVYRYVCSMLNDRETSRDICQEVFITAYNKLYTYSLDSKFSNWLFKIARNKSIDYMRKSKKVRQVSIDDVLDMESREESPEQRAQFDETKRLVYKFMETLNDKDRDILTLKYSNATMTFNDIAQVLNMTEAGVKRRFYRVRDRFRSLLSVVEERCRV